MGLAELLIGLNGFDVEVALYREDDQMLLSSVLLPSGNTQPLEGGSRFVDVDDFALEGGEAYRIATYFPVGNPGVYDDFAIRTNNPIISFGQRYRHQVTNGEIEFPFLLPENGPRSGPNFQFVVVPEPNALLLAVMGVVLLWWRGNQASLWRF